MPFSYRAPSLRPIALVIALTVTAVVAIPFGSDSPDVSASWIDALLLVVVWTACVRVASARIEVRREGVLVRNAFTKHFYDWTEIDEFRTAGGSLDFRAFGSPATLWLADGTKTFVTAIQPPFLVQWKARMSNSELCKQLNDLRPSAATSK